jgi:hypothetical protein
VAGAVKSGAAMDHHRFYRQEHRAKRLPGFLLVDSCWMVCEFGAYLYNTENATNCKTLAEISGNFLESSCFNTFATRLLFKRNEL